MVADRTDEAVRTTASVSVGRARLPTVLGLFVIALTQVPVASAHGDTAAAGLAPEHGLALAAIGGLVIVGTTILKRTGRVTPTVALYGVFAGIVVTALGAVLYEGLSPDLTYTAKTMPFPRSWYGPLSLLTGLGIAVGSLLVGMLRWPSRPRYTGLSILLGLWISYPYLLPGTASDTHPLGYAIVLATPVGVGYIIWTDAGSVLRAVMRDTVARRFGLGVAVALALFFLSVTGYLTFFPDEGLPHEVTVVVLPAIYQLVTWPTLEIALPHVPFFLALSPGQVIVVGLLSGLIGLNAAVIARHWRAEQSAGMTEGTAGSAAIVGTCTCGCCGPLAAKLAILAAGPSIAAPIYWVFVDSASPLSALFIVGSILLFTGSLIHSVESARGSGGSASIVPAE